MGVSQPQHSDMTHYIERSRPDSDLTHYVERPRAPGGEYSHQHISIDPQYQEEYNRLGLTPEQQEKREHDRLGFALGGLFDEWRHPGRRAADTGVASYADRSQASYGQASYGVRSGIMGGFATGGYISGPGTSTSDSIRAPWVSNGEYVIKADRVAQVEASTICTPSTKGASSFANGGSMFADGGMIGNGWTFLWRPC